MNYTASADAAPKKKTIKAPGVSVARTAQACDRCRAKKSKCDGKLPACSSCAAVGIKCLVSDKLSRRAFPKGYTETLEERVRQLEAENNKLQGLLALRDPQAPPPAPPPPPDWSNPYSVLHAHSHGDGCRCCAAPHAMHERPVSLAGSEYGGGVSAAASVFSDDDAPSAGSEAPAPRPYAGEPRPAPGAFRAATALEQMHKRRGGRASSDDCDSKQQLLTSLVAAAVPRTTEETLFVPTLLAGICEHYGYASMAARLTASALAALKEPRAGAAAGAGAGAAMALMMDRAAAQLTAAEAAAFVRSVRLPDRRNLDYLTAVYFRDWGDVCPILNRRVYMRHYPRLAAILEQRREPARPDHCYEHVEKLAAAAVVVVALALLSMRSTYAQQHSAGELAAYQASVHAYDALIREFVKPQCILTKHCSVESLQILALALQYCLAAGDFATCYELRGRVITMAQQLRLHRCPAAVLGLSRERNDRALQHFMQAERRILFWCVYSLDAYASLNLGVPRLLKDYEIECATPFSGTAAAAADADADDGRDDENVLVINNTRLTIFGKVSQLALSVMQFTKVLGNIMDAVFSRSGTDSQERALERDRVLDCWRRDLPPDLRFDIGVNGFSLQDASRGPRAGAADGTDWGAYSKSQVLLIFLYYHAKILIYLPVISKHGYNHNVGVSAKEQLARGDGDVSTIVSSMSSIQQSAIQILELLRSMANASGYILPVPTNVSREHARFALLVAKGSLDYIKGGPLHHHSKQLLLDTIALFKQDSELGVPSVLSRSSAGMLEYSLSSILGLGVSKPNPTNLRKMVITNNTYVRPVARDAMYDDARAAPAPETAWAQSPPARSDSSAPSEPASLALDGFAGAEDLEELLQFDPFAVGHKSDIPDEFVTDGSLGLVPFLEETPGSMEEDRLSDYDGAFYLG